MGSTILAEGLRKRYGETTALDGLDLRVERGAMCGLFGPNGAGKTTAVRILSTLLRPDGGRAEVAGFDVACRVAEVRRSIGLSGQHAAVDELLTGRQHLEMLGRLYRISARTASGASWSGSGWPRRLGSRRRITRGGMRRRLDLPASLILSSPVLFLNEPTTGLDPRGRNEVWESVRSLVTEDIALRRPTLDDVFLRLTTGPALPARASP